MVDVITKIKLLFLAPRTSGTEVLVRFLDVNNPHPEARTPQGVSIYTKTIQLKTGDYAGVNIWNIPYYGQPPVVPDIHLKGASAAILVYEPAELHTWISLKASFQRVLAIHPTIPCLLISNENADATGSSLGARVDAKQVSQYVVDQHCDFVVFPSEALKQSATLQDQILAFLQKCILIHLGW